jgi:predicted amidohydrolase YtcJ
VEQGAYLWKTLWEDDVVVANGTDVPVEKIDPLANFHCTVTRKVPNSDTSFTEEETLTRRQALQSYTTKNAYAAFEEDVKGTLAPGMLADVAVLSKNVLEGPADAIPTANVTHTIVGGEVAYERQ